MVIHPALANSFTHIHSISVGIHEICVEVFITSINGIWLSSFRVKCKCCVQHEIFDFHLKLKCVIWLDVASPAKWIYSIAFTLSWLSNIEFCGFILFGCFAKVGSVEGRRTNYERIATPRAQYLLLDILRFSPSKHAKMLIILFACGMWRDAIYYRNCRQLLCECVCGMQVNIVVHPNNGRTAHIPSIHPLHCPFLLPHNPN